MSVFGVESRDWRRVRLRRFKITGIMESIALKAFRRVSALVQHRISNEGHIRFRK